MKSNLQYSPRPSLAAFCALAAAFALMIAACGGGAGSSDLSGSVRIDGSSTVYPVSEAVAEEFTLENPDVKVTVSFSGTGGGFKKFAAGETDISNASRSIKDAEKEACAANGIDFVRFSVAIDGLAVMVNPQNNWCECLTVEQLKEIWRPGSAVKQWSDINSEWPDEDLHLYGPGTDSGTFDYFTEEVVGEAKASRDDYTASEDDNALVRGIEGDKFALGYFGYAYYEENAGKLKLVGIDSGGGCIKPTRETVRNNTYTPLSRPLFIYVSKNAMQRPEIRDFVRFYLDNAPTLASEVGYVPIPAEVIEENDQAFSEAVGE